MNGSFQNSMIEHSFSQGLGKWLPNRWKSTLSVLLQLEQALLFKDIFSYSFQSSFTHYLFVKR